MKFFVIFSVLLLFLSACKKDDQEMDMGYDYFPLTEGTYVTYIVQEIFHDKDLIPQHDTITYILKRQIGEEYIDNIGRKAHKLYLTYTNVVTGDTLERRVWTTLIDQGKGEVIEENQRKIRMVFAVRTGKKWDLNAYNTDPTLEISYADKDKARIINNFSFDATSKVFYKDYFTLVDYQKSSEVYAKEVGLVKRSFKDLAINNFDTLNIRKGTELHYLLIDYGKE